MGEYALEFVLSELLSDWKIMVKNRRVILTHFGSFIKNRGVI